MTRVVICGASTRAAADSAARAGFAVTTIDAYADRDQHPAVRALSTRRDFDAPFTPATASRLARTIEADAAVYLSSFENHPRAVATLAHGRALWGNPPEVLRQVRDPFAVSAALERRGITTPRSANDPNVSNDWLLKPFRSGGGHGIRAWQSGDRLPRGCYLQQRIDGMPVSIVFAAAEGRAVPLGVSRQLIGDAAFGATGYRYCGSLMSGATALLGRDRVSARAAAIVDAVADSFPLVGVNGVDLIATDTDLLPIEINPRWSASMELAERLFDVNVFAIHAAACADRTLPRVDIASSSPRTVGKAIVFARQDVHVADTRAWLDDRDVRDVPHPGETIRRGQPICTVLAEASDATACRAALVARAQQIYACADVWRREAA